MSTLTKKASSIPRSAGYALSASATPPAPSFGANVFGKAMGGSDAERERAMMSARKGGFTGGMAGGVIGALGGGMAGHQAGKRFDYLRDGRGTAIGAAGGGILGLLEGSSLGAGVHTYRKMRDFDEDTDEEGGETKTASRDIATAAGGALTPFGGYVANRMAGGSHDEAKQALTQSMERGRQGLYMGAGLGFGGGMLESRIRGHTGAQKGMDAISRGVSGSIAGGIGGSALGAYEGAKEYEEG